MPKRSDFNARDELYPDLGWGSNTTIRTSAEWANTCAIRRSVHLVRCGLSLDTPPIGARIPSSCPDQWLRGKAVVPGFDRLARILKDRWGNPTVSPNLKQSDLNHQKGVIAVFGLPNGYPGPIDLIRDTAPPWSMLWGLTSGDSPESESGTGDDFGSRASWFWPSNG